MTDLRKIDALVAEHVFGLRVVTTSIEALEDNTIYHPTKGWPQMPSELPAYSSSIFDAWKVVEKLDDAVSLVFLPSEHVWEITFGEPPNDFGYAWNESAPLAICLAALKSKGVSYE